MKHLRASEKAPLSLRADELWFEAPASQRVVRISERTLAAFPSSSLMELHCADKGLSPETRVQRYTTLAAPTKEAAVSLRADELWFTAPARHFFLCKKAPLSLRADELWFEAPATSERHINLRGLFAVFPETPQTKVISADEGLNPEKRVQKYTALFAPTKCKEASLSLRADELWFQAPAHQCAKAPFSLRADELWFEAPALQRLPSAYELTSFGFKHLRASVRRLPSAYELTSFGFKHLRASVRRLPSAYELTSFGFKHLRASVRRLHLAYELTSSGLKHLHARRLLRAEELTSFALKHLRANEWYINLTGPLAAFSATPQTKLFPADKGRNPETCVYG
ncbi:hypothetical protein NDU88_003776 [Pleurodeles waltl]|uniref:Uncharacterized protein n=1 Tax=Pleurodeles waltl TaxID=8319 RepID=A0AAV7TPY1_PLEWA|nr:hypothetical protein NDU88_003776 [Pleurodeles waltl]